MITVKRLLLHYLIFDEVIKFWDLWALFVDHPAKATIAMFHLSLYV